MYSTTELSGQKRVPNPWNALIDENGCAYCKIYCFNNTALRTQFDTLQQGTTVDILPTSRHRCDQIEAFRQVSIYAFGFMDTLT